MKYLLVIFLFCAVTLRGADYSYFSDEGLGGNIFLSDMTAASCLSVASLNDEKKILFQSGFNRKFDFEYFDNLYIASVYKNRRTTIGVGLAQFGKIDFYSEQILKLSASYAFNNKSFGLNLAGIQHGFNDNYSNLRQTTIGVSSLIKYNNFYIAEVVDDLISSRLTPYSLKPNVKFTTLSELMIKNNLSLLGRVTFEKNEKPVFSFAEIIKLNTLSNIYLSAVTYPLKYGGGLSYKFSKLNIVYSFSYQEILGFSYSIVFDYTLLLRK